MVFDGPYYRTFPAYQFEELAPAERVETRRRQFRLRIVRLAAPAGSVPDSLLSR